MDIPAIKTIKSVPDGKRGSYMFFLSDSSIHNLKIVYLKRAFLTFLALSIAIILASCSAKEKNPGQALARVNGEEITILQLNDEIRRAKIKAEQRDTATKQLLQSLIDQQLITGEAMRNRIDRTPEVVQSIERAKARIIAQAYIDSIAAKTPKPSDREIKDYFQNHPEFFSDRKQYDLQQLEIANQDLNEDLKSTIDSARSLERISSWLDKHNVAYARIQLSLNTADLPSEIINKINNINKGQIFMSREGNFIFVNYITDIKSSPISLKNAQPQIEQYLLEKNSTDVINSEIKRLRSIAKIEYLNNRTQ